MQKAKSILLVLPTSHAREILDAEDFARFQPLGLASIAASTPSYWNVTIIDESLENISDIEQFSIVGITVTTRSALRAYHLAQEAKTHGCYTVAGGIHASMQPEESLRFFDTVISGEGERLWPTFLDDFEKGTPKRFYQTAEYQCMDDLPFPKRSAMKDSYKVGSIQTSRGCPFNCSFCSVTAFNGRRYRFRKPDLVLEELASIPQKYVFFVDDNLIGCSKRSVERAKKIFQGMIDQKIRKKYMAQVTINFGLDEELIELASRSGCRAVFIGIESIDENILRSMNKMINVKTGVLSYRDLFKRIQKWGIAVIGTMAFGNDGENPSIFKDTAHFIDKVGLNAIQITLVTPLPGTRLFAQLEKDDRIVFNKFPEDWIHYSLGSLVFQPKDRSPSDIASGWKQLIDNIYSKPKILKRDLGTLIRTRRLASSYLAHKLNYAYREAYLSSSFYNNPSLGAFAVHSLRPEEKPKSASTLVGKSISIS